MSDRPAPVAAPADPRERAPGSVRLRFAIAPTGHLVLNAARVALANALFAHEKNVRLVLRLDDLNAERCRPAFAEAILHDLAGLGITWDTVLRQSERLARYAAAVAALQDSGRLYPCFESEVELRAKAEHRRRSGRAVVYDRAMLRMTAGQRAAAEAGGKVPYWRFRLSEGTVTWRDMVLGKREAKLPAISDPVLVTADGMVAPVLASVVDDLDLRITHLVRPEENAADTGIYLDVMTCLKPLLPAPGDEGPRRERPDGPPDGTVRGGEVTVSGPRIASIPPIDSSSAGARKLGSQAVRQTLADGMMPAALIKWLTGAEGETTAAAAPFRLDTLRSGPTSVDLLRLNRGVLARTDFDAIADRLPPGATEAFWLAIRADIDLLADAAAWWDVVSADIAPAGVAPTEVAPTGGSADLMAQALAVLPPAPWHGTTWAAWIAAIGPTAEPALYLALTGEETGPAMDRLLPLIGRDRAVRRLRAAA